MSIEKIRTLLQSSNDGIISTKDVTANGIHREYLAKMVKSGEIVRVGCGLYMKANIWEDELYILQKRFEKGVFSHETALFLHGFTDRTPSKFTMTFPHGYTTSLLESENINKKRTVREKYNIGIKEVKTPCNNTVRAYDLERTLCDIVRGQGADIQIVNEAMKRYANMKNKDIHKLISYAEILHVKPKILKYMEILLW